MDDDFALNSEATVEAALQFISDYDLGAELDVFESQGDVGVLTSNGSASSSSEASEAHQVDQTPRAKKRRPAEEIRDLKKQEFELSAKLEGLRIQARDQLSRQRLQNGPTNVDECAGFWERIAARQRECRMRAEVENERLRALVSAQIEKARRMRQVWLKRTQPSLETLGPFGVTNISTIPGDNDEVFAKLQDGIAHDCQAVLRALTANQKDPTTKRAHGGRIRVNNAHRGDEDVFMEYYAESSIPFTREAVVSAAWRAFTSEKSHRNASFRRDLVEVSDSEIKSCASLEMKFPIFGLFVQIRLVARKIVEQQRTVIVVKTFVEPKSVADRQGIGIVCYETFVRVISSGKVVSTAKMETFATLRREVLEGPHTEFWRNHFNVQVPKMVWSHAHASRTEILENILVENAAITASE